MRRTNPKTWLAPRRGTPRPPVEETIRWQVSRLAEQDFSSDPRLPDLIGQWLLGISPVTVAGAAAFWVRSPEASSPIAFPLRLS